MSNPGRTVKVVAPSQSGKRQRLPGKVTNNSTDLGMVSVGAVSIGVLAKPTRLLARPGRISARSERPSASARPDPKAQKRKRKRRSRPLAPNARAPSVAPQAKKEIGHVGREPERGDGGPVCA